MSSTVFGLLYTGYGSQESLNVNIIPVAVRVGVGVRYFYTDFIGFGAEVGLGAPIMQIGFSLKF